MSESSEAAEQMVRMMLSGGGANIYNLDKLIKKKTDMDVTISENSFEAVAVGTGKCLDIGVVSNFRSSRSK